jgi:hypothetical protein
MGCARGTDDTFAQNQFTPSVEKLYTAFPRVLPHDNKGYFESRIDVRPADFQEPLRRDHV